MHINSSLLVLVTALSLIACSTPTQSDGMEELKAQYDFAVSDTASITKIIISDKKPATVVLERTSSGWIIGDGAPVRKDAIEVLLKTVSQVTLKNFVRKSAVTQVNQRMDVYGKWVEVYQGETLVKSYIVGTETPDMLGTYYKMNGSELPFAVYLQGFNGYLTTRFFTSESLWRDRTIYGLAPDEIKSIEMSATANEGSFWRITRTTADAKVQSSERDGANWSLEGENHQPLGFKRSQDLFSAVSSIRTLKYEGAIIESDNIWAKKDSIFSSTPAFTFCVVNAEDEKLVTKGYYKKADGILIGEDGVAHQWDPDRFYAQLPDGRMALIQRYGWRNVMKTPWEFNQ
ncbi:MAG: DUF4340 domain-containing protein [Flavobacteriales bacterium]